jgi:hypothetical protein
MKNGKMDTHDEVAIAWQTWIDTIVTSSPMDDVQRDGMRECFYVGAMVMFNMVFAPMAQAEKELQLAELRREMAVFNAEVIRRKMPLPVED